MMSCKQSFLVWVLDNKLLNMFVIDYFVQLLLKIFSNYSYKINISRVESFIKRHPCTHALVFFKRITTTTCKSKQLNWNKLLKKKIWAVRKQTPTRTILYNIEKCFSSDRKSAEILLNAIKQTQKNRPCAKRTFIPILDKLLFFFQNWVRLCGVCVLVCMCVSVWQGIIYI